MAVRRQSAKSNRQVGTALDDQLANPKPIRAAIFPAYLR